MIRVLVKALLVCLLGPAAQLAHPQEAGAPAVSDFVISTGLQGGGYWNAGNRLQAAARGTGLSLDNRTSTGSLANLKALMDDSSPVNLAFAQADALQFFLADRPDTAGAIEALESIGEECVFVISGSDSDIETDKDMQDAVRLQLGIKSPNSGIRVTFDYMTSLVPELDNVSVHYGDTVALINELLHPLSNIERAVMVVHDPEARSPEIDMVVSNPDKFRFVEISDERLTRAVAGGGPVYRRATVTPGAVPGAGRVDTICVKGLLLTNRNKLSPEQQRTLNELISRHWSQVRPTGG